MRCHYRVMLGTLDCVMRCIGCPVAPCCTGDVRWRFGVVHCWLYIPIRRVGCFFSAEGDIVVFLIEN